MAHRLSGILVPPPGIELSSLALQGRFIFFFFNVFGCVQSQHTGAVACGILVHEPGIEPVLPALQGGFLTTGPPGSPPKDCFLIKLTFLIMKSLTVVIDDSIWGRICFFQRFL